MFNRQLTAINGAPYIHTVHIMEGLWEAKALGGLNRQLIAINGDPHIPAVHLGRSLMAMLHFPSFADDKEGFFADVGG